MVGFCLIHSPDEVLCFLCKSISIYVFPETISEFDGLTTHQYRLYNKLLFTVRGGRSYNRMAWIHCCNRIFCPKLCIILNMGILIVDVISIPLVCVVISPLGGKFEPDTIHSERLRHLRLQHGVRNCRVIFLISRVIILIILILVFSTVTWTYFVNSK